MPKNIKEKKGKKAVVKKAPIKKIKIENNSKQGVIVKQTREKGKILKLQLITENRLKHEQ